MGITWWQFWELNPHKIKIIAIGYNEQKLEFDAMMHAWWGEYGLSAVSVAVEHCIHGRKANSKYIEKPILSQIEISKKNSNKLTKEEKQKQVDLFFAEQKARRVNWKRNQKIKDSTVS